MTGVLGSCYMSWVQFPHWSFYFLVFFKFGCKIQNKYEFFQQIMQMTGDVKSWPSWQLSCHTYSYPEYKLGRLVFERPCEWLGTQLLPKINGVVKVWLNMFHVTIEAYRLLAWNSMHCIASCFYDRIKLCDHRLISRDLRIGRLRSNRIPNRIGRYDSNSNRISNRICHKASSTLVTIVTIFGG